MSSKALQIVNATAKAEFTPEYTIEQVPGVGKLFVGKDLRLYRQTQGMITAIVSCKPVKDSKAGFWMDSVDWAEFPPLAQITNLQRVFFSKFKKEVMVLIGRRWDESGWFYMIPRQTGGTSSIKWEDKEGTAWFLKYGYFVGSIHVHPGDSTSPSDVDIRGWRDESASGLHMIIGRTNEYTVTAAIGGEVVIVAEGELPKEEEESFLCTSMGRPLEELLLDVPKAKPYKVRNDAKFGEGLTVFHPQMVYEVDNDEARTVAAQYAAFGNVGGLFLAPSEFDGLRVVELADGCLVLVTAKQWVKVVLDMRDFQMRMPKGYNLRKWIFEKGGVDGSNS